MTDWKKSTAGHGHYFRKVDVERLEAMEQAFLELLPTLQIGAYATTNGAMVEIRVHARCPLVKWIKTVQVPFKDERPVHEFVSIIVRDVLRQISVHNWDSYDFKVEGIVADAMCEQHGYSIGRFVLNAIQNVNTTAAKVEAAKNVDMMKDQKRKSMLNHVAAVIRSYGMTREDVLEAWEVGHVKDVMES